MKAMTLSGWGQPHDALAAIAPNATHVDYAHSQGVADALTHIAQEARNHDAVIGWSLGGQLAVRAIVAGMMRPRLLVLIAAPFQFVQTEDRPLGMKRDLYDKFRANYVRNAARTLDKAWELIAKGDAREQHVRQHMAKHDKDNVMAKDWLRWLDSLDGFSCDGLYLADFPPTLLVHGKNDAVVEQAQQAHFAAAIPHSRVLTLDDCGHAPHWHNSEKLMSWMAVHV